MTAMARPAGADSAKYDPAKNPVYQIDLTTASTGKVVAQTKRRVRWRFGFSNAAALADGGTGTEARGEEHEVILIWSLTSGKRLVMMDGKEVHFSMGKPTAGKFQTSWTMRGNHVLKIVAYAAPPVRNRPGFRQFELFLDGMSYFTFPRIYELGTKAGGAYVRGMVQYEGGAKAGGEGGVRSAQQPYGNYTLPAEDDGWARQAESYEARRGLLEVPAEVGFATAPTTAASSTDDLMAAAGVPATTPMAPPQPQFDEFAPQAAAAPTYHDVAGSVLNLYAPATEQPPAPQAPQYAPQQAIVPVEQPPQQYYAKPPSPPAQQQQQYYAQDPSQAPQYAQQQPPTQQPYYQEPQQQYYQDPSQAPQYYQEPPAQQHYGTPTKADAIVPAEGASPAGVADLDDVSRALKSLVNFDDITERPVDKLSMYHEDEKTKKAGKAGKASNKSRGQTGRASDCGMAGRSLAEVKQLHGDGMRQPPRQEVMKAPAFDPAAAQGGGMMVVYGAGHDYANGPPPIGPAAGTGFGLGATLPGGGYGGAPPQPQQQQQAYATY